MIHMVLIANGVHLDLVYHLILIALDIAIIGAVIVRLIEWRRQPHWADIADQRRDDWFAHHPVSALSESDGDDGA